MNESCTVQEVAAEPDHSALVAGADSVNTPPTQPPQHESSRLSRAEIAQKVLKLTGSVRLASRSAHHWHHCGINE